MAVRGTHVLIGLNAFFWGGFLAMSVGAGFTSSRGHAWYVYAPATIFLASVLMPILLLVLRLTREGAPRSLLKGFLTITLLGFFPYFLVSGGGI